MVLQQVDIVNKMVGQVQLAIVSGMYMKVLLAAEVMARLRVAKQ